MILVRQIVGIGQINFAPAIWKEKLEGRDHLVSCSNRFVNNIKLDLDVNSLWTGFNRIGMWRWTYGLHEGREYFNNCVTIAFSQKTTELRTAPPSLLETHGFGVHLCRAEPFQRYRNRDSSVGIVTGYGLDGPGSIPGSARFFFSPQRNH
jgi:hypothetical protein